MERRTAPAWGMHQALSGAQVARYARAGIDPLQAQLLCNRGIRSPGAMRAFLQARLEEVPDPLLLTDMPRAVERILRALAARETITVLGDFDADGVSAAALLTRALRMLKHPPGLLAWYIPHPVLDERGLSREAIDMISVWDTTLVVTVDCGSTDDGAVEYAAAMGIDVIVTDHHLPPDDPPRPYALVNPWRPDCAYPERLLSGAGVAFKLVQALFAASGRAQEARRLLDLCAIGTIADVVPLLGENHTLVRHGLQCLNQTENAGLRALMQVARLNPGEVTARDVSFVLGPRLNAARRMRDAGIAFQLLVSDDEREALAYAQELQELNRRRRQLTESLMREARDQARDQVGVGVVIVGGGRDAWPEGIIGLVAGRLSEELALPVVALSRGAQRCRGSGRSSGDLNLIAALRARADLFDRKRYGGHEHAAGFTIDNARLDALQTHLRGWSEQSGEGGTGVPRLGRGEARMIDLAVNEPGSLTDDVYAAVKQIGPFGEGNPPPVFSMRAVRLLSRAWSNGPGGSSLQVRLQGGEVQFRGSYSSSGGVVSSTQVDAAGALQENSLVNVIFCLEPARERGEQAEGRALWLRILHMEASSA